MDELSSPDFRRLRLGQTDDELEILSLLYLYKKLYYSQIINLTQKSKATVNKKLNKLLKEGWIIKEVDASSRPIKVYYMLSEEGRKHFEIFLRWEFVNLVDWLPALLDKPENWKRFVPKIAIAALYYEGSIDFANGDVKVTKRGFERLIYKEIEDLNFHSSNLFEYYKKAGCPKIEEEDYLEFLMNSVRRINKVIEYATKKDSS